MTKIRNRHPYDVQIVDNNNGGTVYECAARPGVVDVPAELAASLLEQEENWAPASKPKSGDKPAAGKEPDPEPEAPVQEGEG
jgi:hypothetical protein